jgi:hypothetical protein
VAYSSVLARWRLAAMHPPQIDQQNTTFCPSFLQKPPVKHLFHHAKKKFQLYPHKMYPALVKIEEKAQAVCI